jgi:membrane associated rhomboid family serine protease
VTEPGPRPAVRITRLLVAGPVVAWVILTAVLTRPELRAVLRFDPALPLSQRPWSLLSYFLVHDGLLHLGLLMGFLLLAGPKVAGRMGTRAFVIYYLYCAAGAALTALVLSLIGHIPPLGGALAPVLGVALAWAWYADPEDIPLDPLPIRASARSLVWLAAVVVGVLGMAIGTPALSVAHLGGLLAGYAFLRIRTREAPQPAMTTLPIRHVVLTRARANHEAELDEPATSSGSRETSTGPSPESSTEVVNRLLDKISESGIESLTTAERGLLAEYSELKRREDHR